jgi:hypothetical protein
MLLRVMPACFSMMLLCMARVSVSGVGVVSGLLVVASFMMLGGFLVVLGGMLMMLGHLAMMFDSLLAHYYLPVCVKSLALLGAPPDSPLTMARQIYNATRSPQALQTRNLRSSA